ncbi:MAG: hypothetical protein IJH39_08365 [Clostridia bacterium]|nr:hypothetical protein [Clostridia bacterium]
MFPGYVTIFKDKGEFVHLYFYPGLDNFNNFYYRDLDLTNCQVSYNEIDNEDGSKEYVFDNKNIIRIVCKLIDNKGKLHIKELTV